MPETAFQLEGAILEPGGKAQRVTIEDIACGGARLVLPANAETTVGLGAVLMLRFDSVYRDQPFDAPAVVVHDEVDGNWRRVGVSFLDWLGLQAALPPELKTLFNTRGERRLVLDPARPVEVAVRGRDEAFECHGVLLDVARGGLSFRAPLLSLCALAHVDHCHTAFVLPDQEPFLFGAVVRHRSLCGEWVRYGVCFDPTTTPGCADQQQRLGDFVASRVDQLLQRLIVT